MPYQYIIDIVQQAYNWGTALAISFCAACLAISLLHFLYYKT